MVEHPAEFELADLALQRSGIVAQRVQRRIVALVARKREQLVDVGEAGVDRGQRPDDGIERLLLLAEGLGPLGVVPDLRILELAGDFGQPCRLDVEVKDTSAAALRDREAPLACWRSGSAAPLPSRRSARVSGAELYAARRARSPTPRADRKSAASWLSSRPYPAGFRQPFELRHAHAIRQP
jgi:hypothetical protein